VRKRFGSTVALDGVSIEVREGEVAGLLGPNGAGKTTLMRIISGYINEDEGIVQIQGHSPHTLEAKSIVGYLPETNPLYDDMNVWDFLDFICSLTGVEAKEQRIREASLMCQIQDVLHRPIKELSLGYRQRVGLARLLLSEPQLLLLDEPTTGLDPSQRLFVKELLKEIVKEKAILLSTHILSEAQQLCSTIFIIDKGRIVASGTVEQLSNKILLDARVTLSVREEPEGVHSALVHLPFIRGVELLESKDGVSTFSLRVEDKEDVTEKIFEFAKFKGWRLRALWKEKAGLQEVFLHLTG
jgi:ABC-2 type transport system ATP-binding protein